MPGRKRPDSGSLLNRYRGRIAGTCNQSGEGFHDFGHQLEGQALLFHPQSEGSNPASS